MRYGLTKCKEATYGRKKQINSGGKAAQRIAQLKAMLQQEEAKQNQEERKRRTGQLVAFGVYIEEFFKTSDDEAKNGWKRVSKSTFQDEILSVH